MEAQQKFYQTVARIAVPVTLQSLLLSSFGVIDQVMTGQLGSVSIAGIGLSSKFASIHMVLVSAVAATAGIMIAQYMGQKDEKAVNRSVFVNLGLALILAALFTAACLLCPQQILRLYTQDPAAVIVGAQYLQIVSLTFLPSAVSALLSPLLHCMDAAALPMYAGICAALVNTLLNYVLIFGRLGMPALGVQGAAIASVISQLVDCLLIIALLAWYLKRHPGRWQPRPAFRMSRVAAVQYLAILVPNVMCEFLWGLGENVYAAIYGHIGTAACAAMTLTTPVQILVVSALSGISQATSVIVGKTLGSGRSEQAYREARTLLGYGLAGSLALSVLLLLLKGLYVEIYQVESSVKLLAQQLLVVFAVLAPVKVQNMILGNGVIRSGGRTKYVMWIDLIGTWGFGVPLGLLAAFVLKWEIPYVYFLLSLEECVRLGLSLALFRRRSWMNRIAANA